MVTTLLCRARLLPLRLPFPLFLCLFLFPQVACKLDNRVELRLELASTFFFLLDLLFLHYEASLFRHQLKPTMIPQALQVHVSFIFCFFFLPLTFFLCFLVACLTQSPV